MKHALAHGAEQQAGEATGAAGADDHETGVLSDPVRIARLGDVPLTGSTFAAVVQPESSGLVLPGT